MEIQHALKILGIKPGATQEEAKSAFKEMAKRHHPDKAGFTAGITEAGERMQEINIAYATLKTVLKPAAKEIKDRPVPPFTSGKFSIRWHELAQSFKNWVLSHETPPPAPSTGVKANFKKKQAPAPASSPSPVQFETVLKQSIERRLALKKTHADGSTDTISNNPYTRYIQLKKQMNSMRRTAPSGHDPIEKIQPVPGVDRIKN